MTLRLLTEHNLEFLSLKGGCTGSSESTLVKITHCWKSHVAAHLYRNSYFILVIWPVMCSLHLVVLEITLMGTNDHYDVSVNLETSGSLFWNKNEKLKVCERIRHLGDGWIKKTVPWDHDLAPLGKPYDAKWWSSWLIFLLYSKACVKRPLKNRQNKDHNDKW